MKKFKIGGACGTHRREKKPMHGFGVTVRRIESIGKPQCRLDDKIKTKLQKKDCKMWTKCIGSGREKMVGYCESGDDSSDSVKCEEFLY